MQRFESRARQWQKFQPKFFRHLYHARVVADGHQRATLGWM
ncbi:MAG: hypothetical protein ACLQUR_08310 [Limisphaerales bacterium]